MNEPLFQHIYLHGNQSYNILKVNRPFFVVPWHFHPEIELMSIVQGEGSRFVGDSIENFTPGDLVLVGSNLPHCWKNSARHHAANSILKAKAYVVLFRSDSFGDDFFNSSEFGTIMEMFNRAQRGICFTGETKIRALESVARAYSVKGVKRFIFFIDLLNMLAESTEYKLLSSVNYKFRPFASDDQQRLNKVFDYLMENFSKPVRLDEIAGIAYMSPTAFCRYFKLHTNKTVVQFLNELRVGYAKKLLIEKKDNIGDIYYLCGFRNASNFYEQFKKVVGCSPLELRKQHQGKAMDYTP